MTKETQKPQLNIPVVSGSALIAEFLGSKFINDAPEDYPNGYYYQPEGVEYDCPTGEPDEWSFNSSWDWLMPVVDKIESLGFWTKISAHTSFDNKYKSFDIKKIRPKSDGEYIYNYEGDWNASKIEAVYRGVIEFIKWWNAS